MRERERERERERKRERERGTERGETESNKTYRQIITNNTCTFIRIGYAVRRIKFNPGRYCSSYNH